MWARTKSSPPPQNKLPLPIILYIFTYLPLHVIVPVYYAYCINRQFSWSDANKVGYDVSAWWHHCCTNKPQCLGQRTTTVVRIYQVGGNYHSRKWCYWWKGLCVVARSSIWWSHRWWRKAHSPFKPDSTKSTTAGNLKFSINFK